MMEAGTEGNAYASRSRTFMGSRESTADAALRFRNSTVFGMVRKQQNISEMNDHETELGDDSSDY
jgi:hypothetical protein